MCPKDLLVPLRTGKQTGTWTNRAAAQWGSVTRRSVSGLRGDALLQDRAKEGVLCFPV